ncbi:MAG: nucleotidyltransferase family protein [Gammaproteobacteria bacterium]|nr:nucleotidyltransferase family protein [Gammaproteobacteria bacterium]
MKAMILAAGRGERLGELTTYRPKPLLEVAGESLIHRHLRRLHEAGVTDIVINLCYLGEQIRSALGEISQWGQRLSYSVEKMPALETGGGIINALPLLGPDPFIVVNADVFTDFDFATLRCGRRDGLVMLVANPAHHAQGDFGLTTSGAVTVTPPFLTYGGVAIFAPMLFDGFGPGRRPLRPILDAAIERGVLKGFRHTGVWQDVGTAERLAEIREQFDESN